MAVNIYAAKTYLSRLIAQVNAGETVVVTRHGHRLPCRSGRFVVHFSSSLDLGRTAMKHKPALLAQHVAG